MRDIEVKIRIIVQNQQIIDENSKLNSNKSKLFMLQLDEIRRQFIDKSQKDLIRLKQQVHESVSEKQLKLQYFEQEMTKLCSVSASSEQLLFSLNQKANLSQPFKAIKQTNDKINKLSQIKNVKIDPEKIAPMQQQLTQTKAKLSQIEKRTSVQLKNLSQQMSEFYSSVLAMNSKAQFESIKINELQSVNTKLSNKIRQIQAKLLQSEEKNHQLFKAVSEMEMKQVDNKNTSIKKDQILEEASRKNLESQTKMTQIQGILARKSLHLDEAGKKMTCLQQKNHQMESILRKYEQNLGQSNKKYEQILKKSRSDKQLQRQIHFLKAHVQGLEKEKKQFNNTIQELNQRLLEHDSRVRHLELLKSRLSSEKQNTQSQNKELHKVISQMNSKITELDSKCHETESLVKTQSMRFFDPHANKSNVFSSKGSFKSQTQNSAMKRTRSNRMESSDEESNCSTLHKQTNNRSTERNNTNKRQNREDLPDKLLKLKEILKIKRKPLPLACEVDQTGYLKDCEQGTYIYDKQHNLFVLNKQQLSRAVKNRIISL